MKIKPYTVAQARQHLRAHRHEGLHCVVCDQWAQEWRRSINSGMARAHIEMYRVAGVGEWVYKPDVLRGFGAAARDESLLRFWGLLEEERELRPDGGRAGYWRVTPNGGKYAVGNLIVPKFAVLYNNTLLRMEGPGVDITDALGNHFSLSRLLRGE